MSKYTPGPWRHNRHPYALSDCQVETVLAPARGEDKDQEVCIVRAHRNLFLDPRTKEEAEADARLIAAAPELLSVLRDAREIVAREYRGEFNAGAPPTGTYLHTLLAHIDQAIAKAEGRE